MYVYLVVQDIYKKKVELFLCNYYYYYFLNCPRVEDTLLEIHKLQLLAGPILWAFPEDIHIPQPKCSVCF